MKLTLFPQGGGRAEWDVGRCSQRLRCEARKGSRAGQTRFIYIPHFRPGLGLTAINQAVAFHFSRVGDDLAAQELLERLDNSATVGDNVDCLGGEETRLMINARFG